MNNEPNRAAFSRRMARVVNSPLLSHIRARKAERKLRHELMSASSFNELSNYCQQLVKKAEESIPQQKTHAPNVPMSIDKHGMEHKGKGEGGGQFTGKGEGGGDGGGDDWHTKMAKLVAEAKAKRSAPAATPAPAPTVPSPTPKATPPAAKDPPARVTPPESIASNFPDGPRELPGDDIESRPEWYRKLNAEAEELLDKIPDTQKKAIRHYTGKGYEYINNALREKTKMSDADATTAANLDAFFKSISPLEDPQLVFRGISIPKYNIDNFMKSMTPGSKVSFPEFLSCTVNPVVADGFTSGGVSIAVEIMAHRGAFVRPGSSCKQEDEFLIPRDSKFRVIGTKEVQWAGSKKTVIQMEQIS